MRVVCLPPNALGNQREIAGETRFALFQRSDDRGIGSAGPNFVEQVRESRLSPSREAWDLISFALAVTSADITCPRTDSPDGWTREINLVVGVSNARIWDQRRGRIEQMLAFLTGDRWQLEFKGGIQMPQLQDDAVHSQDTVCLLSGGLDSLVGLIDLVEMGKHPVAVSQVSQGDKARQREFAELIGATPHVQFNHNIRKPHLGERSQRARSVLFLAYGVLAATSLACYGEGAEVPLIVPENGIISLNVPLTPMRLGSLSTRTTHPVFIKAFQELLGALGIRVKIENPYQFKTKGEMMVGCRNQELLRRLAHKSTSCGRFARSAFQHCGRCVPCLIRRAAFRAWGQPDRTGYKYADLAIEDHAHRGFDDVRSVGVAISTARDIGVEVWAGGALHRSQLGNPRAYVQLLDRGLSELETFVRRYRVV